MLGMVKAVSGLQGRLPIGSARIFRRAGGRNATGSGNSSSSSSSSVSNLAQSLEKGSRARRVLLPTVFGQQHRRSQSTSCVTGHEGVQDICA